ncbi:MAG: DUF262 domain-containing protein [Nitrospira sp.]|nr:DUF262 domain-containing protein [Nitrospira sp.]
MKCYTKTILEIKNLYKDGQIELEPPYQRKPAWKTKQRRLLLSSLFNGIPIPAIIFHRHFNKEKVKDIYDVLDGKQRLETILHFIEEKTIKNEDALGVEFKNPKTDKKECLFFDELSLKRISKEYKEYGDILEKFWRYPIPIIEYEEDLNDIFGRNVAAKEIFVRINSTGSPLKKHEIRHAEWSGFFFELGDYLENKYSNLFLKWKIITKSDIERYLFHEFLLELCTACFEEDFSDRRKKLDSLLSNHKWTQKEISKVQKRFIKTISWIREIFAHDSIRFTRFKNKSDFYSLFVVLLKLELLGYVSDDKNANRIAGDYLSTFSKQIQEMNVKYPPGIIDNRKLSAHENKLKPYIESTRQATDSKNHREIRDSYLISVLKGGFFLKTKDPNRIFCKDVKDILWIELKKDNPKCPNPFRIDNCKIDLAYEDAEVDHIYPWSKGGPTTKKNAQLLCSRCNKAKNNKVE